MSLSEHDLTSTLAKYWAHQRPAAGHITTSDLTQFHGGASRDTYRVTLREEAGNQTRNLVLRLMPEGCLLSDDVSSVETEYNALAALHPTSIPVPEAFYLEEDEKWMGCPFLIVEEISGCEASASKLSAAPYAQHAAKLGDQFYTALGQLAALDPVAVGLCDAQTLPDPAQCAAGALNMWLKEADRHGLPPMPIYSAAVRWLQSQPAPAASRLSIVHGDFRAGNFLYNATGQLTSILDWELCHIGDPHEDLAWSMMPAWSGASGAVGRMLPREHAIKLWEDNSGLIVDADALRWWEVFANVKLTVALANGGVEFREGTNANPQLVVAAWHTLNVAQRTLVTLLNTKQ